MDRSRDSAPISPGSVVPAGEGLAARLGSLASAWRGRPGRLDTRETASLARELLRLQRGLTGDRSLAGAGYMEDPGLLGAYLMYYWPVSYLQVSIALACLGRPRGSFRRVLDLGAGPGPASAACLDAGAAELFLADSSPRALSLATGLLAQGCLEAPLVRTATLDLEDRTALPEGPFDLVVASHLVNELWKGRPDRLARRLDFALAAVRLLAPGGLLLVVEPSLLATSRDLIALRDALSAEGCPVLGPCLRQGPCPALAAGENQTCHAEVEWEPPEPVASLARAAGLDRESVKMTWFAIGRPGSPRPERTEDHLVVSDPMLNKAGRIRYMLCDETGRYAFSARKDDPEARSQGFFGLARLDRIRVGGAEMRGEPEGLAKGGPRPLGFQAATRIELLRRVVAAGNAPESKRRGQA